MKKKLLAAMLSAVMVMSLAACGGSQPAPAKEEAKTEEKAEEPAAEEAAEEPAGAAEGENSLTVWCWDPTFNIYAMEEAAKVYQKDHPDFVLNVEEVRDIDIETKISTAAAAGDLSTLPDIFLMQDNNYQKYIAFYPDVFQDLSDSGINFGDFGAAKAAYSTVDGKHYAVPFDNGTCVGAYRTDMLEAAGLTIEDMTDITWDQYIEYGKMIKAATGNPLITVSTGSPDLFMMMLQSCGASLFNEDGSINIKDNDTLVTIMEVYKKMYDEGVLVEVNDWDQYIGSIQNGTVAGTINGCWIIGSITAAEDQSGKWAITNIPKIDGVAGATNYSSNGGSSWAICANSENLDLAYDFMKSTFAGSVELFETILPSAGAISTYTPAGSSDVYNQPQEFFGGQAIYADITQYATKVPSNITGPYYYDARNAVGTALTNVLQSGADIATELTTAQETVEFNMGG